MADSPTAQSRRRARLSPVAVLAGLLLLLWGVDTAARVAAQSLVARSIQVNTGVPERPEVHIRGAVFLPQLVRGAYSKVDVTTRGITSGDLRVDRVESQLLDVRVPFHDVLVGNVVRVAIAHSQERLHLTYDDVNAYLEATDRPLKLQSAEDGKVRLTGTLDIAGQQISASATMDVSVANGAIKLTPRRINAGGNGSEEGSGGPLLGERLTLTLPLEDLPFGHRLTSVSPSTDGIEVLTEGTAILLQP